MLFQPPDLNEALRVLSVARPHVLAGGTTLHGLHARSRAGEDILDIMRIPSLRALRSESDVITVGATLTWSELLAAHLPLICRGLERAARGVGGRQVQNAGTVGGNVCNASPANDGVVPLLALEASVELRSIEGERRMSLSEFLRERASTPARRELLTAIVIPRWGSGSRSTFLKLGARRQLAPSIVSVAATLQPDANGKVARAAIAVGACTAVSQRWVSLERKLIDRTLAEDLADCVAEEDLDSIAPLSGGHPGAAYRRQALQVLTRRALRELAGDA
jgi:CO/xanthine dehydrogenase FAD-binding subunit